MVCKFVDKKSSVGAVTCARSETLDTQDKSRINKIISSQQLAKELHKPIIRKF